MAARTKKSNTVESSPTDLAPVELDPPDPALAHWEELVAVDDEFCHDGDVSKVIASPRPVWSDPNEDLISTTSGSSAYLSSPAVVLVRNEPGLAYEDGNTLKPARMVVRALMGRMLDQEMYGLELKLVRAIKGKTSQDDKPWMHTSWVLSIPEARELVDVVLAALDLIDGQK